MAGTCVRALSPSGHQQIQPPPGLAETERQKFAESANSVASQAMQQLPNLDAALQAGKAEDIAAIEGQIAEVLKAYEADAGLASLPEIAAVLKELEYRRSHIRAFRALAKGREDAAGRYYLDADKLFEQVGTDVSSLPEGYPNMAAARALKTSADKERKSIAKNVATARKAEAEKEALKQLCGDAPRVSGWDGDLIAVTRFMKDNANDPGSIDVEGCTQPILTKKCWQSTCTVRGKNAFGATIANRPTFYIRQVSGAADGVVVGMDE